MRLHRDSNSTQKLFTLPETGAVWRRNHPENHTALCLLRRSCIHTNICWQCEKEFTLLVLDNTILSRLNSGADWKKVKSHRTSRFFSTGFQKSRILTDKTAWRGRCIALNYLYNPLWVSFRNRYPPLFVLYLVTTPADRRSLITTNRTRGRPGAAATLRVAGSRTPSLFVYQRVRAQTTLQTDTLINRNGDADAGTYFRANMWEASEHLRPSNPPNYSKRGVTFKMKTVLEESSLSLRSMWKKTTFAASHLSHSVPYERSSLMRLRLKRNDI